MRNYMTGTQEDAMSRVRFLSKEFASVSFTDTPCPLLMSQLNEACVLVERLAAAIRSAQDVFAKDSE